MAHRAVKKLQAESVDLEQELREMLPEEAWRKVMRLSDMHCLIEAKVQQATARFYQEKIRFMFRLDRAA
jgi:hypothetical protein